MLSDWTCPLVLLGFLHAKHTRITSVWDKRFCESWYPFYYCDCFLSQWSKYKLNIINKTLYLQQENVLMIKKYYCWIYDFYLFIAFIILWHPYKRCFSVGLRLWKTGNFSEDFSLWLQFDGAGGLQRWGAGALHGVFSPLFNLFPRKCWCKC